MFYIMVLYYTVFNDVQKRLNRYYVSVSFTNKLMFIIYKRGT